MNVRTVLIVEDERPLRDMLASLLEGSGYSTMTAAHGIEALSKIKITPPDLVLTDLMMPILNGAELCRTLKSAPSTQLIPVILMSGLNAPVAQRVGADAFLAKPFRLDEVEDLVAFWLMHPHARDHFTSSTA